MHARFKQFLIPIIATALIVGCQSNDEPQPLVVPTVDVQPTPPVAPEASDAPQPSTPQAAAKPAEAPFDPPFPNRADLFEAPRGNLGIVRRDEEQGGTVELKGFVDVNGPQVVLAIDGVLSPIPEGGEKYGVQVISIKPPQVVLQRGRSRWTASLE